MVNYFRKLFGLKPYEYAWVDMGDEYACVRIKRLPGGVALARVYGCWKTVGISYVNRIVEELPKS